MKPVEIKEKKEFCINKVPMSEIFVNLTWIKWTHVFHKHKKLVPKGYGLDRLHCTVLSLCFSYTIIFHCKRLLNISKILMWLKGLKKIRAISISVKHNYCRRKNSNERAVLFYFFLSVIFLYSFSIIFLLKNLFKVQLLMG